VSVPLTSQVIEVVGMVVVVLLLLLLEGRNFAGAERA
jgi:hypothetical protein